MDVALLLMVLGVMLSGFGQQMRWITYDGRFFDRKEKTWLVVVTIKLCYTVGKAGDLYESEQPTH